MVVVLNPDWKIRSGEGGSWLLERRHTLKAGKRAGEDQWEIVGYYASLEQAARRSIDKQLGTLELETELRSLTEALQIIGSDIAKAIRASELNGSTS